MSNVVILQWNMGIYRDKKAATKATATVYASQSAKNEARLTEMLQNLIAEYQPTLIALQEAPEAAVRRVLSMAGYSFEVGSVNIITAWKNAVWSGSVSTSISYYRMLGLEMQLLTSTQKTYKVLVCNVHLSSRLHGGEENPVHDLEMMADELKAYRRRNVDVEEIILGDFNLEPHQAELQKKTVLHGNRSLAFVAEQEAKRPAYDRYRVLYNPSWRLYGAETSPHGSHYFSGGKKGGPWFILDQALFSSGLASSPANVQMVTTVTCATTKVAKTLLSKKVSQPDRKIGSDHLPLVWTINPKP